jgi:hypothetical protein
LNNPSADDPAVWVEIHTELPEAGLPHRTQTDGNFGVMFRGRVTSTREVIVIDFQ